MFKTWFLCFRWSIMAIYFVHIPNRSNIGLCACTVWMLKGWNSRFIFNISYAIVFESSRNAALLRTDWRGFGDVETGFDEFNVLIRTRRPAGPQSWCLLLNMLPGIFSPIIVSNVYLGHHVIVYYSSVNKIFNELLCTHHWSWSRLPLQTRPVQPSIATPRLNNPHEWRR